MPPPRTRIVWISEDLSPVTRGFDEAGCEVERCRTLDDALRSLEQHPARLIVLVEPTADALVVSCRRLRALDDTPLLAVTRAHEAARLAAFDEGADDVVASHTSDREVLTRAAALLRRAPAMSSRTATFGRLTLELTRHLATFEGRQVSLTAYEFSLLRVLVTQAGSPVRREDLLTAARGNLDASFERSIDVHICRLRRKLGSLGALHVKTVRGVGYVFDAQLDS